MKSNGVMLALNYCTYFLIVPVVNTSQQEGPEAKLAEGLY